MKEKYIQIALENAKIAYQNGDVPVGAIIVKDGEVIAKAFNEREKEGMATAHAEILAIERACALLGRWRLSDCEMYVTLEPCPMCAGAILNARMGKVYFALKDSNAGALGSVINLNSYPLLYKVPCELLDDGNESRELLSRFFKERRKKADK